jgi:hypothetical protein
VTSQRVLFWFLLVLVWSFIAIAIVVGALGQ